MVEEPSHESFLVVLPLALTFETTPGFLKSHFEGIHDTDRFHPWQVRFKPRFNGCSFDSDFNGMSLKPTPTVTPARSLPTDFEESLFHGFLMKVEPARLEYLHPSQSTVSASASLRVSTHQ